MRGLISDINVLRELLDERAPELSRHLDKLCMPFAVITTKWFICMFAEVLPIETVLRVWDCLFLEGSKVTQSILQYYSTFSNFSCIFRILTQILFRVSITLFLQNKSAILECDDINDLANLFRVIVKDSRVTNCHEFIETIFRTPGTLKRSEIERIRNKSRSPNDRQP